MSLSEFELIARYFKRPATGRPDVLLGIGDDCALLRPPPGQDLAMSMDTLVSGVHFPAGTDALDVGYKAMAVNLSDLAAAGARPAWAALALTLPAVDEDWLQGFSAGLMQLADQFGVALVGGDTTRGPLSITVQVTGWVAPGQALRRAGARPGDLIYVTGTVGDAALGLRLLQGSADAHEQDRRYLVGRLARPTPRVAVGQALCGVASAAIDVSDGLAADLGHILAASGVGAAIELARLPLSDSFARWAHRRGEDAYGLALGGGDDYELCFTVPPERQAGLERRIADLPDQAVTLIGRVETAPGLRCVTSSGSLLSPAAGWDHFESATEQEPTP